MPYRQNGTGKADWDSKDFPVGSLVQIQEDGRVGRVVAWPPRLKDRLQKPLTPHALCVSFNPRAPSSPLFILDPPRDDGEGDPSQTGYVPVLIPETSAGYRQISEGR